jgi:hypothetical protein
MAGRYIPAAHESAVGGDWYDVLELGHRRLGLAIGDVAGHGMQAATYMGQLRSALRAYALDTEDPAEVLTKLAQFAEAERSRMATIIYATLNLDTWVLDFARAGHPYPLLIRPDAPAAFLTEAAGPPLGTGAGATYEGHRMTLEPGDTLLLYTDGLIERRGQKLSEGEAALVQAATAAPEEPELICWSVIASLTEGTEVADDIAALVVQSVGWARSWRSRSRPRPGAGRRPAPAAALGDGERRHRRRLRRVRDRGDGSVRERDRACLRARCGEHRDPRVLVADVATISVRDRGSWRDPRGENRGRGIPVMREFMDEVKIDSGEDGTIVELRRRIGSRPR